jgi:hypothetical protein
MKHVFVETNFLVELLQPFPKRDAKTLFARANTDVALHIPWVSVTEAKRTLTRIIRDDLAFDDRVSKLAVQLLTAQTLSKPDMALIQAFVEHIKNSRASALSTAEGRVDDAVASMTVIPPSSGAVKKTMAVYPIKALPPFDEMVLGAVLYEANRLYQLGATDLYFCNANTKDFQPTSGNLLAQHYGACGLTYLPNFLVPT